MKRLASWLVGWLLFFQVCQPTFSLGGGNSWPIEGERIELHALGSYTISLRLLKSDNISPFDGCNVATVEGEYSFLKWLWLMSSVGPVNWEGHKEALNRLVGAKEKQTSIRFGEMGLGLKKRDGDIPCVWESRGLALLPESDGEDAVYSFFDWP